jgi:hypothetical protein
MKLVHDKWLNVNKKVACGKMLRMQEQKTDKKFRQMFKYSKE